MIILDKIQESLDRFLDLENVDESSIILFDEEISSIVKNFSKEEGSSNEDIKTAMEKYIEIFNDEVIKEHLQKYELELDVEKFSQELSSIELAILFEELLIKSKRDCVISDIREAAENFYYNRGTEADKQLSNVIEVVKNKMLSYLDEQTVFHKYLCSLYDENIDEYDLYRNITIVYNSFNFLCNQFHLDYYCEQNGKRSCKEEISERISEFIFQGDVLSFIGGESMESYMDKMYKIADDFYENESYYTEAYIMEVVQELKDIVTYYLYHYSQETPNNAATVFDSFLYLNEKMGVFKTWNTFVDEKYNFEDVYKCCQNESLVPYLKALQTKDYEYAIEMEDEYEIAHYHSLLGYLEVINTIEDITMLSEKSRRNIYFHWSHMGEVYYLTDGFSNTDYLETLSDYNIENVDFSVVLKILEYENNLMKANEELTEANNKIKSIIRSFAHRAVHVEADNIFSVATTLQKNNGNPEDIKKLLLCYEENLDLKRNINILKLEASNDYASFKSSVEDSIASENNGSVLNIFDIINASLKRIFSKILYTDSERTFYIRKSMEQSGVEMDKLVEKYRENILIKDGNCLELLCNNFNFSVESMSEEWNEVRLFKDSDGTTILVSLFMELFLNMFTYADFSKKIRLLLSNDKLDKYTYLSIELLNAIKDEKKVFSTQAGIISTNETLKLLNSDKDGKNEVDEYIQKETTEEGVFKTKILLREYLFF